jgi:hypothetical protein
MPSCVRMESPIVRTNVRTAVVRRAPAPAATGALVRGEHRVGLLRAVSRASVVPEQRQAHPAFVGLIATMLRDLTPIVSVLDAYRVLRS